MAKAQRQWQGRSEKELGSECCQTSFVCFEALLITLLRCCCLLGMQSNCPTSCFCYEDFTSMKKTMLGNQYSPTLEQMSFLLCNYVMPFCLGNAGYIFLAEK